MGKILSLNERQELLNWANSFGPNGLIDTYLPVAKCFKATAEIDLRRYWGLARTARNLKVDPDLRAMAHKKLFVIRTRIENWLVDSALEGLRTQTISPLDLLDGRVFGCSLKQGVSFRLPLSSCHPTLQCAGGCYAHDGLDASIATVIRGALNGAFAQHFEESVSSVRDDLISVFTPTVKGAVANALRDSERSSFKRDARIRMSHVGELTAYPAFGNALAELVHKLSGGSVKCVIYTRHKNVNLLNPDFFVINFTLDSESLNRRAWAPKAARIVYSAWEGKIRDDVDVNFLEHHHLAHTSSEGIGEICPATLPDAEDKTCDGVHCNFCFTKPKVK